MKYLSQKEAQLLDQALMDPQDGSFSIDQLMELAGLAVAQAVATIYPSNRGYSKVLIISGPGNNGGDGLVAARHLAQWKYAVDLYYPVPGKADYFARLLRQCEDAGVQRINEISNDKLESVNYNLMIDALFGFGFAGIVRTPFDKIISWLIQAQRKTPLISIDVPSGWIVDSDVQAESKLNPNLLISLSAPKICARGLDKSSRHVLGGRFIPKKLLERFGLENAFNSESCDQFVQLFG